MAPKNTTKKTAKKSPEPEVVKVEEPIQLTIEEPVEDKEQGQQLKGSRTILVKPNENKVLDEKLFDNLEGLKNKTDIKNSKSIFLTFNTLENSVNAFNKLKTSSGDNFIVKFSYYRIFFTMNGLNDTTDYKELKQKFLNYINSKVDANVVYCKFYRKNDKYLGCGNFTLDTIDSMKALLLKDGGLKNFSFDGLTGTFYRYNMQNNQKVNETK